MARYIADALTVITTEDDGTVTETTEGVTVFDSADDLEAYLDAIINSSDD